MCLDEQTLQSIIDNTYQGNLVEALDHIEACAPCKMKYNALKVMDKKVEDLLGQGLHIPPCRSIQEEFRLESVNSGNVRRFKGMKQINTKWKAAAAVGLCAILLMTEPVQVAADSFLKLFRMQEMETVSISQEDINEIDRLFYDGEGKLTIDNIGTFEANTLGDEYSEDKPANLDTFTSQLENIKVLKPEGELAYAYAAMVPKTVVRFTFDVEKTNEILEYMGSKEVLPQSLHQKTFEMATDSIFSYTLSNGDNKYESEVYLNVSVMGEPQLGLPEGVDVKEVVQAMGNTGLIPAGIKEQLMGFDGLESVFPIPYSEEYQTKTEMHINGDKAIVIEDKDTDAIHYIQVYYKSDDYIYVFNARNMTLENVVHMIEQME